MRGRIRNDPVKYKEYKRKEKKANLQVNDLPEPPHETPSRQLLQGKRQSKKHRRKLHATIKKLEAKNAILKKKMETYKRRCNRLLLEKREKSALPDSPRDKVNELMKNKENMIEEIRKIVLFGEVIKKQIEENLRPSELVTKLKKDLPKYMLHMRNIIRQYKVINDVKNNLAGNEILIHMDFSENYNCKYGEEIQSAHFGGPNLRFLYICCLQCIGNCEYYHLGLKHFENHLHNDYEAGPSRSNRLRYSDVYSSSSDEDEVMHKVTGQKFNTADGSFVIVFREEKEEILHRKNSK
ncbi:unnamed protein product [Psylliodes chrysocephalus]|uniref:Uncharacterized protein n=1 Tax=Psylliodes chrysocephalus TaxID=3402493 RepID=A0A9P0D5R3_9CUCU|nr:unnamed protein product [Psylliodes chrysocephala]